METWESSSLDESATLEDEVKKIKVYYPDADILKPTQKSTDKFEISSEPGDCIVFAFDNCKPLEMELSYSTQAYSQVSEIETLKSKHPGYCIAEATDLYAYASFAKRALCISSEWLTSSENPDVENLVEFIIYEDEINGRHNWVDKTVKYSMVLKYFLIK